MQKALDRAKKNPPHNELVLELCDGQTNTLDSKTVVNFLLEFGVYEDELVGVRVDSSASLALVELTSLDAAQFAIDKYYSNKANCSINRKKLKISFAPSCVADKSTTLACGESSSPHERLCSSRDLGREPSPLILVRQIPEHVTAAEMFDFVEGWFAETADHGDLLQFFLIKKRVTRRSLCYGIIECATVSAANALLCRVFENPCMLHLYSNVLQLSFAHAEIFTAVDQDSQYVARILHGDAKTTYYEYWHKDRYASVFPWSAEGRVVANPDNVFGVESTPKSLPNNSAVGQVTKATVAPAIARRKTAAQLARWKEAQHHAERDDGSVWTRTDLERSLPSADEVSRAHTNWELVACLLCLRGFPSFEHLDQHIQRSEMHREKLTEWSSAQLNLWITNCLGKLKSYRDRAQELKRRRESSEHFSDSNTDSDSDTEKTLQRVSAHIEQPTVNGIGLENRGNVLLRKMGWTEGQGLGKNASGIAQPIQPYTELPRGAGIGSKEAVDPSFRQLSYKEASKLKARQRYNQL